MDRQKIPVRFAITSAGLTGSDGATHSGAFDVAYMSCLPNMIVMAPSDETELVRMVNTAVNINDRPVCFRFPRGATVMLSLKAYVADPKPIEVVFCVHAMQHHKFYFCMLMLDNPVSEFDN